MNGHSTKGQKKLVHEGKHEATGMNLKPLNNQIAALVTAPPRDIGIKSSLKLQHTGVRKHVEEAPVVGGGSQQISKSIQSHQTESSAVESSPIYRNTQLHL